MSNLFEVAPSTKRTARHLSKRYGFKNPKQLAESLPPYARVADFGAGKSHFGKTITDLRPDVMWLNIDVRTGLFQHAQRQQRRSSSGLQYIKSDIFAPPIRPGTLDRVYSSWLLPHIELESGELAVRAVHAMASLLNETGILSINASGRLLSRERTSVVSAEEYYASPAELAVDVVRDIALDGLYRRLQIDNNRIRGAAHLHKLP
jgi:hypothetical protein